ncbi:DUF6777 domain-containing protein [Pseudonocardia sp.]|uniref:DUF6777 domain-containing protein n=1 Tax=Pseudonocardia sp. TaxID=60912 RepID=UPI003D122681
MTPRPTRTTLTGRGPAAPTARRVPGLTLALAATAAFAAFGLAGGPAASTGGLHLVSDASGVTDSGGESPEQACDVAALATALTEDPERAAAWAGVRGIAPEEAGGYLVTLSPVALDGDAAFTRFTYEDGGYAPHEADLPAGTEVLVDGDGIPAATCDVGDPLAAASDDPGPAPVEYEGSGEAPAPDPGEYQPDPGHETSPMGDPGHDPMGDPGHDPMSDPMGDPGHDPMSDPGTDTPPGDMGLPGTDTPPGDMS